MWTFSACRRRKATSGKVQIHCAHREADLVYLLLVNCYVSVWHNFIFLRFQTRNAWIDNLYHFNLQFYVGCEHILWQIPFTDRMIIPWLRDIAPVSLDHCALLRCIDTAFNPHTGRQTEGAGQRADPFRRLPCQSWYVDLQWNYIDCNHCTSWDCMSHTACMVSCQRATHTNVTCTHTHTHILTLQSDSMWRRRTGRDRDRRDRDTERVCFGAGWKNKRSIWIQFTPFILWSTDHNFWRERRAEVDSNQGPCAYHPNLLAKPAHKEGWEK